MALSKRDIKSSYPLPSYNYRVTVLGEGDVSVIGFSDVSGLSVECQPVTYRHGLSFTTGVNLISGMRQTVRLTLKKGLMKNGDFLQKWLTESYSDPYSVTAKRDVIIDLCDEAGLPVIRWKVIGALPVKLDAPNFSASSNEIAIASMELIAVDLKVDYQPS
ncbi:MAG: phage tail protein [Methylococcaceae bacterium]|nr:phage tail protein [Methylococcaceae bacterium]